MQLPGVIDPIQVPEAIAQFAGRKVVLFCHWPTAWANKLWGGAQPVNDPGDWLAHELITPADITELCRLSRFNREAANILEEQLAAKVAEAEGYLPIGWHVPGEGNLTRIFADWAQSLATKVISGLAGETEAILSLGGRGQGRGRTTLRYVDVVSRMKALPWRCGGSVNTVPVSKRHLAGFALLGVAMSYERPQTLLQQGTESDVDFANGEVTTSGWPQFFAPKATYGEQSDFTENNVSRFTGHVALRFKANCTDPELEVVMATAAAKAVAIETDLRNGICHIPHDQLKNASTGNGTRATWLVDGVVISLPGSGSKPEKFLNRNKLISGTAATVENPVDSALRIHME